MNERGQLWWIADNVVEVEEFKREIAAAGGTVIKVDPDPNGQVNVIFEVDRVEAVRRRWAESLESDNWLVPEKGTYRETIVAPLVVKELELGEIGWRAVGDFDSDHPELIRSRLSACLQVNGLAMHLEAWEVQRNAEGILVAVHPDLDGDLDSAYAAFNQDSAFETTTIEGHEYMIFAFPFGD